MHQGPRRPTYYYRNTILHYILVSKKRTSRSV
uniref:Uncharacterized protein n=1 Tax=Arundo donax TaxID=35708 RepID=A0A0A9H7U6_ARUDO